MVKVLGYFDRVGTVWRKPLRFFGYILGTPNGILNIFIYKYKLPSYGKDIGTDLQFMASNFNLRLSLVIQVTNQDDCEKQRREIAPSYLFSSLFPSFSPNKQKRSKFSSFFSIPLCIPYFQTTRSKGCKWG